MAVVVDAHKAIGKDLKGFGSQSKIHTRNNTGASGKIYFGTKQGYPDEKKEKREDYPGGYPMVYDPATKTTKVYPIPVAHHGINSITPDEARGVFYVSTCSDGRPGPGENSIFLKGDLKTGQYQVLYINDHPYGFIVIDYKGRAYHPIRGGDIVRYDPATEKVERLKQLVDGKKPEPKDGTNLAEEQGHAINWDISPDGKTLYSQPMATNNLYVYDLTEEGDTLHAKGAGELIPGAKSTDCRAMCVGPKGTCWAAITEAKHGISFLHLVSFKAGDKAPRDHGPVSITNPNFTEFVDNEGKALPFHGGVFKMPDGTMTSRYVILGVCEGRDGAVNILMLHPYSVLRVEPTALK
jgi:sugar lactone lactonase YvrE